MPRLHSIARQKATACLLLWSAVGSQHGIRHITAGGERRRGGR